MELNTDNEEKTSDLAFNLSRTSSTSKIDINSQIKVVIGKNDQRHNLGKQRQSVEMKFGNLIENEFEDEEFDQPKIVLNTLKDEVSNRSIHKSLHNETDLL